jgi:transmembrane sensor
LCALVGVAVLLRWNPLSTTRRAAPVEAIAVHFATRHGEQLTQRLADNSVLHLNTDSAVRVRYGNHQRSVELTAGQASFDVVHDANRVFQVRAGSAEITDLGTSFDVRLEDSTTVVTVVAGRVAVGRSPSSHNLAATPVELSANQQLRVGENAWPAQAVTVDASRSTSWVQGKLSFDNETLERVAAEFNRYTSKTIEIATLGLRKLRISGVFATDDTDAFIAFLRSLKGVRVEVTETHILVSGD